MGGFISGNGTLPYCAVADEVTQFTPCPPGTSVCELSGDFTAQCAKLGGFIDGTLLNNGVSECAARGDVNWFTPCGPGSCSYSLSDFTTGCSNVGGQITAIADDVPVCVVNKYVSSFRPCPLTTGSCSYSSSNFASVCTGLGGFVSGTDPTTSLPICTVVSALAL